MYKTKAKRLWIIGAVIVGGWTIAALILSTEVYLRQRLTAHPYPFRGVLTYVLLDNWLWASLTPLIFLFARRFPLSRTRVLRTSGKHIFFFLLVCAIHIGIADLLKFPLPPVKDFSGPSIELRFLFTFYSDIWMYWPLVALWSLLEAQRKQRETQVRAASLQAALAKARLDVLLIQLQPHFLLNTLNSISALVQKREAGAAEDMIEDLGFLLRNVLQNCTSQEIFLSQELEVLEAYVRIQSVRFQDHIVVQINAPAEVRHAMVPSLLIQPLVENAIRHGAMPLARPGRIEVHAHRDLENLIISVSDNGRGLPDRFVEGVGISNTKARLQQLYGGDAAFHIYRNATGGTTATVVLPYHQRSWDDEDADSNNDRGRRATGEVPDPYPLVR